MKRITAHYECGYCKFKKSIVIETNEYGFFEIPNYYCPNDLSLVSGIVKNEPEEIGGN